jgi:predicted Zn-dependent peptidase
VNHIEAVTAETIQSLAEKLFRDDKMVLTVLGPLSNDAPFQEAMQLT